jgi:hypothetical protein
MAPLSSSWSRWLIGLAYPAAGLVLGLADPVLGRVAQQAGMKPGVATAVSVNLLLPLVAVGLGLARPRLGSVWLGAFTMTLGLIAGLAAAYAGGIKDWSPVALVAAVPPVLVMALIGYAVFGTMVVLAARAWRAPRGANGTAPV